MYVQCLKKHVILYYSRLALNSWWDIEESKESLEKRKYSGVKILPFFLQFRYLLGTCATLDDGCRSLFGDDEEVIKA